MFPYYFIRFSGPVLFVLVGLKVLSGYAVVGRAARALLALPAPRERDFWNVSFSSSSYSSFMPFSGLRLFLIDLGTVKRERLPFWVGYCRERQCSCSSPISIFYDTTIVPVSKGIGVGKTSRQSSWYRISYLTIFL